mmetsp:Transcript_11276/g.17681  ORF Transcript_11276/g.17681 Transcript_11276/m.17681 type:complete len:199 (+) Transcript_11276:3-599(+)
MQEMASLREGRLQELDARPALRGLFARKGGAPRHCLVRDAFPGGCPLAAGLYNLVPRSWLQAWRAYLRDPQAPRPGLPETAMLLCEGHGKLAVPPHVLDWLRGRERRLLENLGEDSGCVCEVLSAEEWDALGAWFPCDLSVRFLVDPADPEDPLAVVAAGEGGAALTWGVERCHQCDPCHLGLFYSNGISRKLSTERR